MGWRCALLLVAFLCAPPALGAEESDPWFGPDKSLHLSISLVLSGGATSLYTFLRREGGWYEAGAVGVGGSLLMGLGKEIYDEAAPQGSGWSWRDLTWDLVGSVLGAALVLSIEALFRAIHGSPQSSHLGPPWGCRAV